MKIFKVIHNVLICLILVLKLLQNRGREIFGNLNLCFFIKDSKNSHNVCLYIQCLKSP